MHPRRFRHVRLPSRQLRQPVDDSVKEGDRVPEAYRQSHRRMVSESSGRNESERRKAGPRLPARGDRRSSISPKPMNLNSVCPVAPGGGFTHSSPPRLRHLKHASKPSLEARRICNALRFSSTHTPGRATDSWRLSHLRGDSGLRLPVPPRHALRRRDLRRVAAGQEGNQTSADPQRRAIMEDRRPRRGPG